MKDNRRCLTPSGVILILLCMVLLPAGVAQAGGEPPKGILGCCLPDLTCADLDIIDCISAGGIRQPRPCSSSFCGACCSPTGCIEAVVEEVCTIDFGGEYGGDESDCATFCLPGACCLPGGACQVSPSGPECIAMGGVFQGIDSTCEGVICRGCGILGSVDTPRAALDVAISGTLVYVAVGNDGLFVIDVSSPASPAIVGFVDPGSASGVAISGTLAYVADSVFDGMHVIDVSDPANPAVIGGVVTTGDSDRRVAVSGTIAYVPDSFFLHVIDVSNPENPVEVGSIGLDFVTSVAVSGTVAYVGDSAGLRVIDVSDPTNPSLLGSVATGAEARDIVVSGTLAYLASTSGLHVIDVSDSANPAMLGFAPSPGSGASVAVSGTVAYLAHNDFGVQVVDVSDPLNPVILKSIAMPQRPSDIVVSGALAYVAEDSGLSVINASSCGSGVCCLTEGCVVVNAPACDSILGTYLGDGTTCVMAACPPPCPADINGDGSVGFADVLRALTDWGPCP